MLRLLLLDWMENEKLNLSGESFDFASFVRRKDVLMDGVELTEDVRRKRKKKRDRM